MSDKRLSTRAMINANLASCRNPDSVASEHEQYRDLHEKVKVFEAVVWFPRLQTQVNGTDSRGMGGEVRGIKIMTWCCAGRCLIQLEREGHTLTLITADDEKPWMRKTAHVAPNMGPMGIQHVDADYVEALKLLYEATRYGVEITLVPDNKVTIDL
jgi:hypothetical protein